MSLRTVSIHVSGRVQGVWFRASAKREADVLHINGFVRNEPDGSVYIEASGQSDSIDLFIAWCHRGPELARVDRVDVREIPAQIFDDFMVSR